MNKKTSTKQRILNSALKEFSSQGFSGARMENIAKGATINKAMIFYYFTSKKDLYHAVFQQIMLTVFNKISEVVLSDADVETHLEKLPEFYITFFSKNQDFIKMIAIDSIQNPFNVISAFSEFFQKRFQKGQSLFINKIKEWHKNGIVSEDDPIHFIINIISLSLFSFIGKPVIETIFNFKFDDDIEFYKKRIQSVQNILKRGMLK